jgi:hypothetical protein
MLGTHSTGLTRDTSCTIRGDAVLIIEITEAHPDPAANDAHRKDLPACLAAYGIPQALILTALQKLPALKTLRLCKSSPSDEWEIQASA